MTSSASRRGPAFLNVTVPAKERNQPSSETSLANSASPLKQWNTVRSGAPTRRSVSHDLAVRVPVVDLQREAALLGDRDVRLERRGSARRARPRPGCGRSRARSRRRRARAGAPRARRCRRGARRGCPPRRAPAPRSDAARRRRARAARGMPARRSSGRSPGRCRPARRRARRRSTRGRAARGGSSDSDAVRDLEVRVVVVHRDDERLRQRRVLRGGSASGSRCRVRMKLAGSPSRGSRSLFRRLLDAGEEPLDRGRACPRAAAPSAPAVAHRLRRQRAEPGLGAERRPELLRSPSASPGSAARRARAAPRRPCTARSRGVRAAPRPSRAPTAPAR